MESDNSMLCLTSDVLPISTSCIKKIYAYSEIKSFACHCSSGLKFCNPEISILSNSSAVASLLAPRSAEFSFTWMSILPSPFGFGTHIGGISLAAPTLLIAVALVSTTSLALILCKQLLTLPDPGLNTP